MKLSSSVGALDGNPPRPSNNFNAMNPPSRNSHHGNPDLSLISVLLWSRVGKGGVWNLICPAAEASKDPHGPFFQFSGPKARTEEGWRVGSPTSYMRFLEPDALIIVNIGVLRISLPLSLSLSLSLHEELEKCDIAVHQPQNPQNQENQQQQSYVRVPTFRSLPYISPLRPIMGSTSSQKDP